MPLACREADMAVAEAGAVAAEAAVRRHGAHARALRRRRPVAWMRHSSTGWQCTEKVSQVYTGEPGRHRYKRRGLRRRCSAVAKVGRRCSIRVNWAARNKPCFMERAGLNSAQSEPQPSRGCKNTTGCCTLRDRITSSAAKPLTCCPVRRVMQRRHVRCLALPGDAAAVLGDRGTAPAGRLHRATDVSSAP